MSLRSALMPIVRQPLLFLFVRGTRRSRVLVTSGDDYLVIKTLLGNGQWSLPGGGLHRGEADQVGAARELLEETGIVVTPADITIMTEIPIIEGIVKYRCVFCSIAIPNKPEITVDKREVLAYKWLPMSNTSDITLSPEVATALKLATK